MVKEVGESLSYAVAEHHIHNKNAYKVQRSRSGALFSSLVHIVPVAVTFGILQLSFRNYYWADADVANQRAKLSALQIAAKVHEILILVSLSSVVLHYTRKLMVAPGGVSFGLLEAAYQSGLSSNPWTIGNWQALKHLKERITSKHASSKADYADKIRAWHLVVLLVLFAFLAIFIGPASAITLLPQLGWWHRGNLIGLMHKNAYDTSVPSVYVPKNLFPLEVDKSFLPASCNDATKDTNGTCPSARIAEVLGSFTIPLANPIYNDVPKFQNNSLSLSRDDPVVRHMLYVQLGARQAAVTVPNYLLASFASLIKLPTFGNTGNYQFDGPRALELFAQGTVPLNPLVGVDCNDTTSDIFGRDYKYELDGLNRENVRELDSDVRKTATIDIRSIWSEEQLHTAVNGTELVWKDVTDTTNTPVTLALMRHEQNVTVCTVQAYWTPTSQWVLSTSNYDVATNFTFDHKTNTVSSKFGYPYTLNAHKIHLHEGWVETLNAVNGSTRLLDTLLQFGMKTIKDASSKPSPNSTLSSVDSSYQYFEGTISQLLAKAIANGLSRIGAEYAADNFRHVYSMNEIAICNEKTRWCSQGPWFPNRFMPLAIVMNSTYADAYRFDRGSNPWGYNDTTPVLRSFPKPPDADKIWTHISFPIRNYGYAYAFQGVTMYLAVVLLCLHAAIVLVHVVYRVVFDCQTFDFGESLGSLLILALGDRAPGGGNLWSKRVAVVPFGTVVETEKFRLEVVETESVEMKQDKAQHVDPEEEILMGSTMWSEARESRYPSVRIREQLAK